MEKRLFEMGQKEFVEKVDLRESTSVMRVDKRGGEERRGRIWMGTSDGLYLE
jgi:hypothetical protein